MHKVQIFKSTTVQLYRYCPPLISS